MLKEIGIIFCRNFELEIGRGDFKKYRQLYRKGNYHSINRRFGVGFSGWNLMKN